MIFDVGACEGSTVIEFKTQYPDSSIYCFEPFPESFKLLESNVRSLDNITCVQKALSNKIEIAKFYVNRSKATNSLLGTAITNSFADEHSVTEKTINVGCVTFDSFLEEKSISKVDILKLDVQGGELMVLEGAKQALHYKKIGLIYTEIWFLRGYTRQPLYHDIAVYLSQFGYLPFGVYNMHYRKDGHFLWGDAIFYAK